MPAIVKFPASLTESGNPLCLKIPPLDFNFKYK